MSNELSGKTIAFLATDGVEQVELTEPWRAIEEAGGTPHLVSIRNEPIQGFDHQDKAETFEVDDLVTDTSPDDFDALVLPRRRDQPGQPPDGRRRRRVRPSFRD